MVPQIISQQKIVLSIFFSVFFAVCFIAGKSVNAQTPSPLPVSEPEETSFFLTAQDKMLEGIPEERGDSWLLRLPGQTGGLLLSKLDVIFIGQTRESVFQFKREHIKRGNIEEIAKLADWGARNRLADSAVQLLKETAEAADPEVSKVLQRKIDRIEYVERLKKDADLRTSPHSGIPKTESEKDPEMKRLESFARQVPLAVQDTYVRKIQPVLLRRCAISDCHLSGTPNVELTFVKPENRSSLHRGNLANLEQILRRVEFTAPTSSPILNHPEIADLSGVQVFPFGSDAGSLKDFTLFSDWVVSLGGKIKEIQFSTPISSAASDLHQEQKESVYDISTADQPRTTPHSGLIDLTEESSPPSFPLPKYRKVTAQSAFPSADEMNFIKKFPDEFDPAPFNEKYHPEHSDLDIGKEE